MPLFERVAYHISRTLPQHLREDIARMLDPNGAAEVDINNATHIVSDTVDIEGCDALKQDVAFVSPYWVERSMELGQLQDPKYFSANKDLIFSGVVATSSGIPSGDKEVIIAGIKEQGGQWREGLTRDVTHLFVTNTQSDKYRTAMHFRDSAHITILLPQWFDQCWSMQMRIPHDIFEFPDPAYLKNDHDHAAYRAQMFIKNHTGNSPDKQAMFRGMQQADTSSSPLQNSVLDIWEGRAILLSSSLGLDAHRRESVETRIRRAGGKVVKAEAEDESTVAGEADVLVTRFRAGAAYARALAEGKMIGTLAWLFYVHSRGVVSQPRDQLLHYPVRNRPIEGFAGHEITVTNYQGEARDYLKKLIEIMGAKFTPTMSGRNTIVIAAYKGGNKTDKADEWSVPVVTHKWLEDCFVEWRNLTPAQKRYIDYAPGVNYGTVLGERGVGRVGLEGDPELLPAQDLAGTTVNVIARDESHGQKRKDADSEGLTGTATSAREAREVEEVEHALDLGDGPDRRDDIFVQDVPFVSPTKIGPPRGVKKTPSKSVQGVAKKPGSTSLGTVGGEQDSRKIVASPRVKKSISKQVSTAPPHSGYDSDDPAERASPVKLKPKLSEPDGVDHRTPEQIPATVKPRAKIRQDNTSVIGVERNEGCSEDEEHPHPRPTSKGKSTSKTQPSRTDERHEATPQPRPATPAMKKTPQPELISDNSHSDEEHSQIEETSRRAKNKRGMVKYQSKVRTGAKDVTFASGSESDGMQEMAAENSDEPHSAQKKGKPKAPVHPSPNRTVIVDLPDPRSLLGSVKSRVHTPDPKPSSSRRTSPPAKASPSRHLTRANSISAAAYEAPSATTPKRGRPLARRSTITPNSSSSPSPHRLPRGPPGIPTSRMITKAAISRRSSPSPSPPLPQRTLSSRTAAAAAIKRLHEDVMPDANNYENERKRGTRERHGAGHKRKGSQHNTPVEDDEEGSEARPKRRKKQKIEQDGGSRKGKRARSSMSEEPDVHSAEEADVFITHVKPGKRSALENKDDRVRKKLRKKASGLSEEWSGSEAGPGRSSYDPKKIRVLATKVEISDHTKQALGKLGVKFAKKHTECTHLVSTGFARTEKFLCALPNAPFVLHEGWLTDCVKSGKVVAERDYLLKDPEMEKQHNFKLKDALERAQELKRQRRKLLEGHFFYVTKGVSIPYDLLKNVLQTNGAESLQQTPTSRNLSDTRHIVSCEEDQKIWRPLAREGFPIYSHELILMAALAQSVDWDGENKRVRGSLTI